MNYHVVMIKSDEGYAVSCPALRGCHSQGDTSTEALENIREAIREWLAAEQDDGKYCGRCRSYAGRIQALALI